MQTKRLQCALDERCSTLMTRCPCFSFKAFADYYFPHYENTILVSKMLQHCCGCNCRIPKLNKILSVSALFKMCFLGDQIAGMLAVAVASSRTLEVLDLEGTGLTNQSAQVYSALENAAVYPEINTDISYSTMNVYSIC